MGHRSFLFLNTSSFNGFKAESMTNFRVLISIVRRYEAGRNGRDIILFPYSLFYSHGDAFRHGDIIYMDNICRILRIVA